jgi:hypothetical protein
MFLTMAWLASPIGRIAQSDNVHRPRHESASWPRRLVSMTAQQPGSGLAGLRPHFSSASMRHLSWQVVTQSAGQAAEMDWAIKVAVTERLASEPGPSAQGKSAPVMPSAWPIGHWTNSIR